MTRNRSGPAPRILPGAKSMNLATGYFGRPRNLCAMSEFPDAIAEGNIMHSIIYIVGLIVVVMAVLSFFGLR